MIVEDLRRILFGLPDDMEVVMEMEGGRYLVTACVEQSDVEDVLDTSEEGIDQIARVFCIRPCHCEGQELPVIPNPDQNFN